MNNMNNKMATIIYLSIIKYKWVEYSNQRHKVAEWMKNNQD